MVYGPHFGPQDSDWKRMTPPFEPASRRQLTMDHKQKRSKQNPKVGGFHEVGVLFVGVLEIQALLSGSISGSCQRDHTGERARRQQDTQNAGYPPKIAGISWQCRDLNSYMTTAYQV